MMKKENLLRFLSSVYGKGFISGLSLIFLCAAVTSAAQFILTYDLGVIIDSIGRGFQIVIGYFIVISIAVVFNVAGNAAWGLLSGRMTNRFMKNIRNQLGLMLCKSEFAGLEKNKDGDLLSIATNDAERFRPWLNSLYSIGLLPAKMVLSIFFLFLINWKLSLGAFLFIPLAMLPSLILSKKLYGLNMAERETAGKAMGFLDSTLSFMLVVKSFCLEKVFLARNRRLLSAAEKARMNKTLREQVIQTFGRCLGNIMNPLIFIAASYFILHGEMTIGQTVTIILLGNIVGEALNIIYAIPTGHQEAAAVMKRVKKILDLKQEESAGETDASEIGGLRMPALEMRGIFFAYGKDTTLDNINFTIRQGEKIAVVGMSGSGKTTLFKLLCGLYKPERGQIYYRGADMAALSVEAIRRNLSVAPQESFLFNGSIRDNVKIARPDASDEEMLRACENAEIHGFIATLENGYDTELKDANRSMSKGQMQRLNLARAFLKDAPVYLLDEPTSALDIGTHNAVMDYILDETVSRTVIVIIHRLTDPQRFDKVLMMENGTVAGFDSHERLLSTNKAYRAMLDRMASTAGEDGESA